MSRPTEVTLVTGDSRPVTKTYDNGYDCPWCFYPVEDDAPGCRNPACVASPHTSEEYVRATLARLAEEGARRAEQQASIEWSRQYVAEERAAREAQWAEVLTEAEIRGACPECLRGSSWQCGRPRYVRHRTTDYHQTRG